MQQVGAFLAWKLMEKIHWGLREGHHTVLFRHTKDLLELWKSWMELEGFLGKVDLGLREKSSWQWCLLRIIQPELKGEEEEKHPFWMRKCRCSVCLPASIWHPRSTTSDALPHVAVELQQGETWTEWTAFLIPGLKAGCRRAWFQGNIFVQFPHHFWSHEIAMKFFGDAVFLQRLSADFCALVVTVARTSTSSSKSLTRAVACQSVCNARWERWGSCGNSERLEFIGSK